MLKEEKILVKVNKYTKAGQFGKTIYCPFCSERKLVSNFRWVLARCQKCRIYINKTNWNIYEQ